MNGDSGELDNLSREIRKIIADNMQFLEKIMHEDFEPEQEE